MRPRSTLLGPPGAEASAVHFGPEEPISTRTVTPSRVHTARSRPSSFTHSTVKPRASEILRRGTITRWFWRRRVVEGDIRPVQGGTASVPGERRRNGGVYIGVYIGNLLLIPTLLEPSPPTAIRGTQLHTVPARVGFHPP